MSSLIITIYPQKAFTKPLPIEEEKEFPIQTIVHQVLFPTTETPLKNELSFGDTVTYLKSRCDHPQSTIWTKQLAIPLIFRIRDDTFHSTTFDETVLAKKNHKKRNIYHYFELYEATDKSYKHPLMILRTDPIGENCELTHIKKRNILTGNLIKEISDRVFSYLRSHISFANDESARELSIERSYLLKDEFPELHLKDFLAVSSDEGDTWYGKNGYFPADFINAKTFERKKTQDGFASQSSVLYYTALEKVRNTKIADLYNNEVFVSYENTRNALIRLAEKHLGLKTTVENPTINFGNTTIHDLGKILLETSKKGNCPKIDYDLLDFQRMFLTPWEYEKEIDKVLCDFNLAVDILWRHFIWKKDFTKTERPISYRSFMATLHESFDQIASNLYKPDGLGWDDLVEERLKPNLKRPFSYIEDTDSSSSESKRKRLDSMKIIEDASWYSSPEEFMEEIKSDLSLIQRSVRQKSMWLAWMTVPNGWNGNPNQLETHLHLDVKPFRDHGFSINIREFTEDNAEETAFESKPVLLNICITAYARLVEFFQKGERIEAEGIKAVGNVVARYLV